MSENCQQSEIRIVIDDISQGSIANRLSYDGLLHCKFITQFAGERVFKIGEHLTKLQTGKSTVSCFFSDSQCSTISLGVGINSTSAF